MTLLVSFLVVGMPHLLPCPAPRVRLADSRLEVTEDVEKKIQPAKEVELDSEQTNLAGRISNYSKEEELMLRNKVHECPVPKPTGYIGQLLGFASNHGEIGSKEDKRKVSRIEIREREN